MPGGDRPERVERVDPIPFERPDTLSFDRPAAPERVERVDFDRPDYDFERQDVFFNADRPDRPEYSADRYNLESFDPYVGATNEFYGPTDAELFGPEFTSGTNYWSDFSPYVGYAGGDFGGGRPAYNPSEIFGEGVEYNTDSARGMDTSTPAQELDWWEKFKTNLSQAFTPQNVGRNLVTSALLNLATGGTATPLMMLGGAVAGGIAGAGGRTVAEQLPDEYAGARNFLGSATGGGIGAALYGQNPLIGAAAGGLGRLGSDVTREAFGGEMGDIAGAAIGGGIRTGIRGGEFSEGAESGMYSAALESAMTGGAGGNAPGSAGRAPGGGMSDLARMTLLGRGLYGMREARELRRAGEEAARMADPWGASGGRGRADAQLQALLADPQAAAVNDPAFKLRLQAAQRLAAVHGTESGAMAVAAANASTDWYNQRLAQLGEISGAGVNPSTAAELRMAGRRQGADLASQSLATLGYGMAMRG